MLPTKVNFLILQCLVVAFPAALILYYVFHAGALPDNDYWGVMEQLITEQGEFSTQWYDWLKRSNEHYTPLPNLIYAVNVMLTGGNNVALSFFSWLMALLQLLVLYRLLPVSSQQQPVVFLALLFICAVFIFSPRPAHNWLLGMSGTAWISANFFSIAAIAALHCYAVFAKKNAFYLTLALSLCAVASYSTGLAVLPTLMIAAFLYPLKRHDKVILAIFGITILSLYLTTYTTPVHHPAIQRSLSAIVTYSLVFIGGLFTLKLKLALVCGGGGLLTAVLMLVWIYREKRFWLIAIPWVSILLYVSGTATMAALARSGFGLEQALDSRYGSLPALFWLAWLMLASICLLQSMHYRTYFAAVLLCMSSAMIVQSYSLGISVAEPLLERAKKKPLALVSMFSQAYDLELIHAAGIATVSYARLQQGMKRFIAIQHIPFNGLYADCPQIGSQFSPVESEELGLLSGNFTAIRIRNNKVVEIKGWAYGGSVRPLCVALTNQHNKVRGIAYYGLDSSEFMQEKLPSHIAWQGYGKFYKHDKIAKVYVLTANNVWHILKGRFQIRHQPLEFQKL